MFARALARLFGTAPRTPIRNARRTRLNAEALEARDVPANFWWVGGQGPDPLDPNEPEDFDANIVDNWLSQANFSEIDWAESLPGDGDSVFFQGDPRYPYSEENPPVCLDCDGFGWGKDYLNVSIASVYNAVITLDEGFTTVGYSQANGTVDQPGSDTDITVTGSFLWTKGTINETNHVAELTLDGATGYITPLNEGAVSLGSNVSVINAAVLNVAAGTISILNSYQVFTIADGGGMVLDPGANAGIPSITIEATPDKNFGLFVEPMGFVELRRGLYHHGGYITNYGGRVTTKSNTTLWVHGTANSADAYMQVGGQTQLYGNSKIKLDSGKKVDINDGKLCTIAEGQNSTATIETHTLKVRGDGDIVIGDGSFPHVYGILNVVGNVEWSGGTYRPVVEGSANDGPADKWYCTLTFYMSGTPKIAPGSVDCAGYESAPEESNWKWLILEAGSEIVVLEGSNPPAVTGYFVLDPVQDTPVKKWRIKSVVD